MASEKKVHTYTSFNSGEYSPELAGRVDLESFGASTRHMSNMMSQISGGIKKFYGTRHITEITPDAGASRVKFVPFINKYEPMMLVFFGSTEITGVSPEVKIGLIYGDNYRLLNIVLPSSVDVDEMRWKQINDVMILTHASIQPMSIVFYGVDSNGDYIFQSQSINFTEIPYFPVGGLQDFTGELEATGISGKITLSVPSGEMGVRTNFPSPLLNTSTYTRSYRSSRTHDFVFEPYFTVSNSTVQLIRRRSGVDTVLASGICNQNTQGRSSNNGEGRKYWVDDTITRERILQVIKSVSTYKNSYLYGDQIIVVGVSDNQAGDEYYLHLTTGAIVYNKTSATVIPSASYNSILYETQLVDLDKFVPEELIGRKIKFYFNDDTVISPWWQGKTGVQIGDYCYSNGHWYKAESAGTCGNIQPSHIFGMMSDGGVTWRYVHSGTGTATITAATSTTMTALVNGEELPNVYKSGKYKFRNYAWSIWGYHGVHPSEVYMVGNRLGFICNTDGYGAWNSLSVTDDYYNFSTEEYGEQLDTSAIVHLIGNNESGAINWVLSRKNVYMGSYSGEYNIKGASNNILTPTQTVVDNISNMGGKPVIPLKYKELNMFVGPTGKELYTIGYDYTIEDYTPHSLGYLTQHIMDKGVRRIEALKNLDRNIYLLHDTNELSLFNYAREQKVMGFSELDFGDEVVDFATTYANEEVAGYVATVRNGGKITIERLAIESPTYMFDTMVVGNGTPGPIPTTTHFAGKIVWVEYGDEFENFVPAEFDENGDIITAVPASGYYRIGLPMLSELHTQPAFGQKVEGNSQQSLYVNLRLNKSGSFEYGCSVDFDKYYPYKVWDNSQNWGDKHDLFTGDATLNIPLGYTENANQGDGPYPNTTGVGINIRSDTPEPLNLLAIQEIYK